eukprot:Em0075g15a
MEKSVVTKSAEQPLSDSAMVDADAVFLYLTEASSSKVNSTMQSPSDAKKRQMSTMDTFVQKIPAHGGLKGHDHNQADHLLLEALCANLLPSSLVDSPEFRCFLEFVSCGAYVPPHRTKMTELIDAQYEKALSKIKTLLFAATSVSITTDAATMHTGDSYVTVTAHWLDAKWKMMSCVLGVAISNVSHTAEEIASLVKDLVNVEFMLENRLDSIGTDQGANFLAAVRLLIEEGVSEEQVRCSCHKLQLSIKNSLEEQHNPQAAALVTLFRAISNNINNSPMLLDALRKHQCNPDTSCVVDITANMDDEDESNDEPSTSTTAIHDPADVQPRKHSLKLIKDVCTRWNSTFYMLQRCVLLKESIIHVLAESKYANLAPTDEQWLAAAKLCILLKPFQIATDFMQGEEYPP